MRNYVMSFGVNEKLVYFKASDDEAAADHTREVGAEYVIRLRGERGPTKYTVWPVS